MAASADTGSASLKVPCGVNPTFLWDFDGWLEPLVLFPGGTPCILAVMDPTFSQQSGAWPWAISGPAGTPEGVSAAANEKLSIFVHKGHAEIPIPVQTSEVSVLISQTQREPFQPQPAQTLLL